MPKVIPNVVDQFAEEAAFLWQLREGAVSAPHYLLADLARLDARVEAQLDGLGVVGEPGWSVVRQVLEAGQAGETFAASVLAFQADDEERVRDVVGVAQAKDEKARGLSSALGWLAFEQASKHIKGLLAAGEPALRRAGIAAAAIHRRNPGPALLEAFANDDPPLKARSFRAAGELGLVDTHITLRANLKSKDRAVQFWAAWSNALLIGHKDAVAYLQNVAEGGGCFAERAAQMAMRRLAPNDAKTWLKRLVRELGQKRIAIIAAGAFADPEGIPFLIEQMKVARLSRVAGDAFSLITGANIAYEHLEGQKPEGFEAGPTENPEEDDVAMDADLDLAWPDPTHVQKWWITHHGNFAKGTRYLLGRPITLESLRLALENGYQRQRAAAAIELALLNPGKPLFEVRAPAHRQRRLLASEKR
jgi:uncharacterized protein (TIGR02270 family)